MHDGITGVFPKSAGMLFFGSFIKARAESERLPLVNGVWISPAGPLPDSVFKPVFYLHYYPFPGFSGGSAQKPFKPCPTALAHVFLPFYKALRRPFLSDTFEGRHYVISLLLPKEGISI